MGYFTSAFVCTGDLDESKLAGVAPSVALLAVRHEASGLCLLAAWDKNDDEPAEAYRNYWAPSVALALQSESKALGDAVRTIERFTAAAEVASDEYSAHNIVRPALQLGWLLQRALGTPLFFFAANDDGLNFACSFSEHGLVSAFVDGDTGTAEFTDGEVSVRPCLVVFADEDEDDLEIDMSPLDTHDDVVVHPTKVVHEEDEEEKAFFSAPLKLWPAGWPDPKQALGLGTWDPLSDYPGSFTTLFARR